VHLRAGLAGKPDCALIAGTASMLGRLVPRFRGSHAVDVASAPFFSIKLGLGPTNLHRASMLLQGAVERIGGFPKAVLVGEDTLFDFDAAADGAAFQENAKALYHPKNTFRSACTRRALCSERRSAGAPGKAVSQRCQMHAELLAVSLRWSLFRCLWCWRWSLGMPTTAIGSLPRLAQSGAGAFVFSVAVPVGLAATTSTGCSRPGIDE